MKKGIIALIVVLVIAALGILAWIALDIYAYNHRLTPAEPMNAGESTTDASSDNTTPGADIVTPPELPEANEPGEINWRDTDALPRQASIRIPVKTDVPEIMVEGIKISQETTIQDLLYAGFEIEDQKHWMQVDEGSNGMVYFTYNGKIIALDVIKQKGENLNEQVIYELPEQPENENGRAVVKVDGLDRFNTYYDIYNRYGVPHAVTNQSYIDINEIQMIQLITMTYEFDTCAVTFYVTKPVNAKMEPSMDDAVVIFRTKK